MKNFLLLLIFTSTLLTGCTKDGGLFKSSASAGTTGAGGSMARFAILGNYLYTVDDRKLRVYDLTDAANPQLKNTVDVGLEIETIYPFKDKLFIGSTSAVHIVDISDPVSPKKLSTAISPEVLRRCDPVVAKENVAYATLRTSGLCGGFQSILAVYDITDILKPVQKFSISVSEPFGLGYSDNVLYVCDKNQGLLLFDISQPYQPVYLKSMVDGSYTDLICYQNTLICWVKDGVLLYDITHNQNPVLLSKIQ